MGAVCSAFAYATELSLSTLSATAALMGAATFALISDIAARSGNSSPASAFSSSRVSFLYSSLIALLLSVRSSWAADRSGTPRPRPPPVPAGRRRQRRHDIAVGKLLGALRLELLRR